MISKFERIPNEILLNIFGYLSWDKILISFWSLNRRMNSLIYSIFSIDKYKFSFNQQDLSYKKFSLFLLPLIWKSVMMFKQLIRQFFSNKSQLTYLRFDIADDNSPINIHQCLTLSPHPYSSSIFNKAQYCCLTLRYLYICSKYTYFLEQLIEYIPNIERLSVTFKRRMDFEPRSKFTIETLIKFNRNWFEK
ncbi:unnamed protein product [Rotaria sp. Silwood1]|nr:unnamed protein product [Rotaria sp. Silwood1]